MRRCFAATCAILFVMAVAPAHAATDFTYNGPDEILIVGRPNSAGSNVRSAELHSRALPAGEAERILAPLVSSALEGCSLDDVRRVVISPARLPDRVGDTGTRIHGLGLYLNLPLANRVSVGNFYLAPFFAMTVSVIGDAGPLHTFELFDFTRVSADRPGVTEETFLDARTADVEAAIVSFAKARLGVALRKALGARCPAK